MVTSKIKIYRGSKKTLSFNIDGKHDDRKIYFAAKTLKTITAERVIDLKNLNAGGADSEITAIYDDVTKSTSLTIILLPEHTEVLELNTLYFDVDSVNVSNNDDSKPLISGIIELLSDVRTPFDGFPLPTTTPARFQQLDATAGQENGLFQVALDAAGKKYMKHITIAELKTQLGI